MKLDTLFINGKLIIDAAGKIDWNNIKNTPSIMITNNNHTHSDRYYTKNEVDDRLEILDDVLSDLREKIINIDVQQGEN